MCHLLTKATTEQHVAQLNYKQNGGGGGNLCLVFFFFFVFHSVIEVHLLVHDDIHCPRTAARALGNVHAGDVGHVDGHGAVPAPPHDQNGKNDSRDNKDESTDSNRNVHPQRRDVVILIGLW